MTATLAAKDKTQKKIKGYVWLADDQLLYEARNDAGGILAPMVIEFIGRKFGTTYQNTLLDHEIHHLRSVNEANAQNEASAIYQVALIGLESAITKDGFEPYTIKFFREEAKNSTEMDALLLTTMAAAD